MRRHAVLTALLLAAVCGLYGCGGDDGGGGVVIPAVTGTFPADEATGVSLNTLITVTFSREMDEATLDSIYVSNMTIFRIDYDSATKTAAVYVDSLLEPQTAYQVKVSSYCMDKDGNNLDGDYTFDFTTGVFGCDDLYDPFGTSRSIATAGEIVLDKMYKLLPSCGGQDNMHYFKFTLAQATKITLHYKVVAADTNQVSWRVYYMRADEEEYSSQGSAPDIAAGSEYQFRYSFLPGTYYVKTGKTNDTGHTAVYQFMFEVSEACTDDTYEDNDFMDQAPKVPKGLIENLRACYVDKDFFAVDVLAGQSLWATVTQQGSQTDLRQIRILDSDGRQKAKMKATTNPLTAAYLSNADATYYVEILWWVDDVDYDLEIDITGP